MTWEGTAATACDVVPGTQLSFIVAGLWESRHKPKLGPLLGRIEQILADDEGVPRKQRHAAKRIFERLREEGYTGGYTQVQASVAEACAL